MDTIKDVELVRIVQTCPACPSQWDAWTKDGTYYYIRYRFGLLTVNKGGVWGDQIFAQGIGDSLAGTMTTEEMLDITGMVLVK